jgi:hypothetical protein
MKKMFWATIFAGSAAAFVALGMPWVELFFGIDIPGIIVRPGTLNILGFAIYGKETQLSALLASVLLMMIPIKGIHASVQRLAPQG